MTDSNPTIRCDYRVDAPYPPIKVAGQNRVYACQMLSNMADVVSEMSGVTLYFYIAVVTKAQHPAISNCFHHISIVEMHHLDMFAQLALLLGEDPRLWYGQGRKCYWSPSYNDYPGALRPLIAESIQAEESAIREYSRQANTIKDENIVAILRRIIQDEERHLQIFREMYRQV